MKRLIMLFLILGCFGLSFDLFWPRIKTNNNEKLLPLGALWKKVSEFPRRKAKRL